MARVVTLTANSLLDFVGALDALVPGRTNRARRLAPCAGGKGLNAARVLAAFGHEVVAVSFAGGGTGRMLEARVSADGVTPRFVETRARTRVGFEAVAREGTTAVCEDGFEVDAEEVVALLAALDEALVGASLCIVAGSVPHPSCDSLYERALALAARRGVSCWLDAYGPAADRALAGASLPALVKPNREELSTTRGYERCPELHLTDGANAIEVRRGEERWHVTPPRVAEVNAIGSGDTYLAVLAHARLSGMDFERQLAWAAAAGAANAARVEVACVGPGEVEALVPGVVVGRSAP